MLFQIPMLYIWFVVIVICCALEAITFALCSVWFAAGGVIALIAASFGATVPQQLFVFVLFSAIFMVLIRPLCRRFLFAKQEPTNADRIIGETAVVVENIDNLRRTGQIRVYGQIWAARSNGVDANVIPKDEIVRVVAIQGAKAVVEKL